MVLEEFMKKKTTSKRSKGKMLKKEDEDEEDRGARRKDDEIEMLIALRGEMDNDFKKNGKKNEVKYSPVMLGFLPFLATFCTDCD